MTAYQLSLADYSEPITTAPASLLPKTALAIAAKGVGMNFQSRSERYQALKSVDLELKSGKIQLLMGPSGSGKTTLLSILAGILTPTEGSVRLLGQEITGMSRSQLARFRLENIGFIFQGFNLFPALTALENIEVALTVKGVRKNVAAKQARSLLAQVGLTEKANQLPRDLSGGQKQRVAIARALGGDPKLIMADEPTAALDSQNGHAVIELLHRLAKEQNRTVLMVTHDARIMDFADSVIQLEDGMLKQMVS
ncbi:ABC transporter ATP-binding protein [Stenomitos frigidus]|uniref:ABC transporter ATP-binding protein n=1 Tax=Stenomitos frigidus ULC18 TaxID=2107698 RepID=A0A2T1E396_9CYAN|nr:ABC transporter ATP-binding protein [Stenomitos frigidus]PSB27200.1 ABC transporter ATP-binding protein [Stenomitos frigidus ULC18]